jgi:hypothetical protein
MGVLTKKHTGGLEVKFGSAEALTKLAEMTGTGEGFGKEIGLGSKRLCEKYGHPELSMSVKGQEFPAYDGRGIQGIGLAYATSNRGACHLRGYTIASEVLGIPEKTDPLASDGKAGLVKAFQDATAAVDSSGLCVFTTFAWTLDDIAPQIDGACEGGWTAARLLETGERIWNMERLFNLDAGFTAKDDTLPKRLLKEAAKTGPAKGKVKRPRKDAPRVLQAARLVAGGGADQRNGHPACPLGARNRSLNPDLRFAVPAASPRDRGRGSGCKGGYDALCADRRRPGRRGCRRNPSQGGPGRGHPAARRRAGTALFADGAALFPGRHHRRGVTYSQSDAHYQILASASPRRAVRVDPTTDGGAGGWRERPTPA